MCYIPNEGFTTLVIMLYQNLNHLDKVLTYEVKKQWICLSLENFIGTYNFPITVSNYDEEGNDFDFLSTSISFLSYPKFGVLEYSSGSLYG